MVAHQRTPAPEGRRAGSGVQLPQSIPSRRPKTPDPRSPTRTPSTTPRDGTRALDRLFELERGCLRLGLVAPTCCWSLTTSSSEATNMSKATAVLFGIEDEFDVSASTGRSRAGQDRHRDAGRGGAVPGVRGGHRPGEGPAAAADQGPARVRSAGRAVVAETPPGLRRDAVSAALVHPAQPRDPAAGTGHRTAAGRRSRARSLPGTGRSRRSPPSTACPGRPRTRR